MYYLGPDASCICFLDSKGSAVNQATNCPACGKKVTVGVLNRVEELADRQEGEKPETAAPFRSFIPLAEVVGQVLRVGPGSKTVAKAYSSLLERLGPELGILGSIPIEEINDACTPVFAEAIARMREDRVIRDAGYDGEYGTVTVFADDEITEKMTKVLK